MKIRNIRMFMFSALMGIATLLFFTSCEDDIIQPDSEIDIAQPLLEGDEDDVEPPCAGC